MTAPLLTALLLAALTTPQEAPKPASTLLDITLERQSGTKAEAVSPEHVFATGDVIRIRLTSHYTGFLYVMDQGSSGHFTTVFPAADTGSDNRLVPDHSYLVPATQDGWFTVEGPAGFDVLYFLLSPTPLATPSTASFALPAPISSLKPRCNDKIFRARGECMDATAGPAALPAGAPLPAPIAPLAGAASRDITVTKKSGTTTIATPSATDAPVIYTFRLAHK